MSIDMLSSCGVLQSSHVRIATEELGFVDGIPTLPGPLAEFGLVKRLRDYGVITEITISDIKSELEKKALNVKQLGLFLEWIGNKAGNNKIDSATIRSLLGVAIANDDEEVPPKLLVLGDIKNYLNVSRIPAEMPVPPSTMLFKYTKKISKTELNALGWEDLQMVPWLRWLLVGGCDQLTVEQNIEKSEPFARAVLPVISKQFDGLSQSSKATVIDLLASRTIIPTKLGMRKPVESYFPSVNVFGDLPVISSLQSVKEKFLIALGVRWMHSICNVP